MNREFIAEHPLFRRLVSAKSKNILLLAASAIILTLNGCSRQIESAEAANGSGLSESSEPSDEFINDGVSAKSPETEESLGEGEVFVLEETVDKCSFRFSYTQYSDDGNQKVLANADNVELLSNNEIIMQLPFASIIASGWAGPDYEGKIWTYHIPSNAEIKFEVFRFNICSIAVIGIPDYKAETIGFTFYCFDSEHLQMLGDGYFFPVLFYDDEINVDFENETFSFVTEEGQKRCYTVCIDKEDSEHFMLQPV